MHRRQKHTNSWEKGHFDAFNPVVKALEYRVTCFLEDSAFFYTNSTRVKLHGSDVNKLRGTGAHCHIWRFYRKFRQKIWNQECAFMLTGVDETIARSFGTFFCFSGKFSWLGKINFASVNWLLPELDYVEGWWRCFRVVNRPKRPFFRVVTSLDFLYKGVWTWIAYA